MTFHNGSALTAEAVHLAKLGIELKIVKSMFPKRFPATLESTVVSVGLATLLGIPCGLLSALKRNSWLDHSLRVCTTAGLAITGFWLAIMLQLFFSMDLDMLPLGGRIGVPPSRSTTGFFLLDAVLTLDGTALLRALSHMALPALTLAYPAFATIVRFTRAGALDVLQRDFILYEQVMGLPITGAHSVQKLQHLTKAGG